VEKDSSKSSSISSGSFCFGLNSQSNIFDQSD
jgi:hypothetical protein